MSPNVLDFFIFFLGFLLILVFILKRVSSVQFIRQHSFGNARVAKVIRQRRRYDEAKKVFADIPAQAWDQRYFYSVAFSRVLERKAINKWLEDEPDSADAWLVNGASLVIKAWAVRGYGRGHDVSEDRWQRFYDALEETQTVLLKAAELNPADPTPWAYLIMIATWGSADEDLKREYFENAVRRDAENWAAHIHMIIALSKKWGGSHEAMYRFARDAAEKARLGSDVPVVLIKAHMEYFKYLNEFEEDHDAAMAFLGQEDVVQESMAIYEKTLGHPQHQNCATTVFVRYNFTAWLWALDKQELLRKEFDTLGKSITEIHWFWTGFEEDYDAAREFAYS